MSPAVPVVDPRFLQTLRYRCIGPTRGGRVVAVAADPVNPAVFYFGACAGGVWKSDDGGQYWQCVSDGYLNTSAIGALAVAPSDPNIIYAGTGETTIRIDVSHGDGLYKSTDAGQSWQHLGLAETRHIGEIRIHPRNPDLVYVAALGHAFRENPERGVYRSQDGGQTWEQILFVSDKAGAVDLSMDPHNPRILYAAIWQARRKFWSIESGGEDSGLWRSVDGGDTWQNITRHPGLPEGAIGKIGVAVSPAQSGRVWALVEAEGDKRGLFRSDNGGDTWQKVCSDRKIHWRPWYFSHVFAHPTDPETVYVFTVDAYVSHDGGHTFKEMTTPHGDNHDLWIDPRNPQRMIGGDDGGAWVTFNGGRSWSTIYNQSTAQFYHLTVDNQYPYRVYGTQQDNSSVSVPSRTGVGAITWADCYPAGTAESGYVAVHPQDPNIVYVGAIGSSPGGGDCLQRYDHRTKQIQLVTVWPEAAIGSSAEARYRFQWTYPIIFSPHNPDVLYACGNVVFKTENEGQSWEAISPDLTYADPETLQPSGGPLTYDRAGAETYATIFAFAPSPHDPAILWAGSDDGLIHVTHDGGQTWDNVTPPEVEKFTQITMIEASPHDPATVYVTAARHKMGDYAPYVYKTNDHGQTWHKIVTGLPADDFCRVVREDPARRGLLYVGLETGLYVSFDDGAHWQPLQANLPVTPIYDLVVKDNDLVVGTHGRAFWILDDVTPLHQLDEQTLAAERHLFQPRDTVRIPKPIFADLFATEAGKSYHAALGFPATYHQEKNEYGEVVRTFYDAGEDVPYGVTIHYYFKEASEGEVTLSILDAQGELVKAFTSVKPEKKEEMRNPVVRTAVGMNRFQWDMRYRDGVKPQDTKVYQAARGPLMPPGDYQVRLETADWSMTQPLRLLPDPRVTISPADFEAQYQLQRQIQEKLSELYAAVNRIQDVKAQLAGWLTRLKDQQGYERIQPAAEALTAKLTAVQEALINLDMRDGDALNKPTKLNAKLMGLTSVVGSADAPPTQQAREVFAKACDEIDQQLAQLHELIEADLAGLNGLIAAQAIPAIVVV